MFDIVYKFDEKSWRSEAFSDIYIYKVRKKQTVPMSIINSIFKVRRKIRLQNYKKVTHFLKIVPNFLTNVPLVQNYEVLSLILKVCSLFQNFCS